MENHNVAKASHRTCRLALEKRIKNNQSQRRGASGAPRAVASKRVAPRNIFPWSRGLAGCHLPSRTADIKGEAERRFAGDLWSTAHCHMDRADLVGSGWVTCWCVKRRWLAEGVLAGV